MKKHSVTGLLSGMLLMMVMLALSPLSVFAEEAEPKEMTPVSIGGINYYYTNVEGDADDTVYRVTVRGRNGASTEYTFQKSELTQVDATAYYYTVVTGVTPLSGTVYGYTGGTATNYREVYSSLGVSTDSSYDAISSATKYTGHHVKDIPSLVTFGKDASDNKAITGLQLGRTVVEMDAAEYVEAAILNAAGENLDTEQEKMLETPLKTNPMSAPAGSSIAVEADTAVYQPTSKYGIGEFKISPKDTVTGYVWSEYWNSIYAITISDGKTAAGAVHWIDMYGEAAVSGPHYNNLEIAMNNGKSMGTNEAEVNRFAAFFDPRTGEMKSGTYTITVYAEGYDTLEVTVEIPAGEAEIKADAVDAANAAAAEADKITAETYPEESAKAVADAAAALQTVLAKDDATAEEIAAATKALTDAIAAAEKAKTDAEEAEKKAAEEAVKKAEEEAAKKAAEEAAKKAAEEAAKKAAEEAAKKDEPETGVPAVVKGETYTVSKMKYKVTNADLTGKGTVTLVGTTVKKAKLTSLTVKDSVKINGAVFKITAIGSNAFSKYNKLKKAAVGKNVLSIAKGAFQGDGKLKNITIKSKKLKTVGKNAVKGIHKKAVIKVPKAKLAAYRKLFKSKTGFKKTMTVKK